jgi:fucose 4-O-acetylase-like acetyltransferase
MKTAEFGTPVLGVVVALALSVLTFEIARRAAALARPLELIGRASLVIMFTHLFVAFSIADRFHRMPEWELIPATILVGCLLREVLLRVPVLGPLVLGDAGTSFRASWIRRQHEAT